MATDICSFSPNLVYKPFNQFSMHDKDYPLADHSDTVLWIYFYYINCATISK